MAASLPLLVEESTGSHPLAHESMPPNSGKSGPKDQVALHYYYIRLRIGAGIEVSKL